MRSTIQSISHLRLFSIFIASIIATCWPENNISPSETSNLVNMPGIGAKTFKAPAVKIKGADAASQGFAVAMAIAL